MEDISWKKDQKERAPRVESGKSNFSINPKDGTGKAFYSPTYEASNLLYQTPGEIRSNKYLQNIFDSEKSL